MNKLEFDKLMMVADYATPIEIRFEKPYLARRLVASFLHWTNIGKMRYLVCWKYAGKTVTVRKFWHNQPCINIIRQYYDELSIAETNQLVSSPLFKV